MLLSEPYFKCKPPVAGAENTETEPAVRLDRGEGYGAITTQRDGLRPAACRVIVS